MHAAVARESELRTGPRAGTPPTAGRQSRTRAAAATPQAWTMATTSSLARLLLLLLLGAVGSLRVGAPYAAAGAGRAKRGGGAARAGQRDDRRVRMVSQHSSGTDRRAVLARGLGLGIGAAVVPSLEWGLLPMSARAAETPVDGAGGAASAAAAAAAAALLEVRLRPTLLPHDFPPGAPTHHPPQTKARRTSHTLVIQVIPAMASGAPATNATISKELVSEIEQRTLMLEKDYGGRNLVSDPLMLLYPLEIWTIFL